MMFLCTWIFCFLSSTLTKIEADYIAAFSLSENGTITDPFNLPYCGKGQKISLLDYSFRIKECQERCQFEKRTLSLEAQMLLHDSCSLKQECDSLSFHQLKEKPDGGFISYTCLDNTTTLYDICGDTEEPKETKTGTVQLISDSTSRQYATCKCQLTGANDFSVTLKDIRLYSLDRHKRTCSNSILHIDRHKFLCGEISAANGTIFNVEMSEDQLDNATTISLMIEEPSFLMIWITVKAQEPFMVKCNGFRASEKTLPVTKSSIEQESSPNGNKDSENQSSLLTGILIIIGIIGIFGIIVAVYVIQLRSRARNSSNYNTQTQQESGAVSLLTLKNISQKSNVKPVAEEESVQTLEKRTDNSNEIARDGSEANAPFTQPLISQALNEDLHLQKFRHC